MAGLEPTPGSPDLLQDVDGYSTSEPETCLVEASSLLTVEVAPEHSSQLTEHRPALPFLLLPRRGSTCL